MSRVHHIELRCEVDPHGESIHGEMSLRQGRALPFEGWTELAMKLVALARDEDEPNQNQDEEQ